VSSAAFLLLAGCGSGGTLTTVVTPPPPTTCKTTVPRKTPPAATANYAGSAFSGKVLAGTTPMIGASVQIYAAGATGNASAPTALLGSALVTDANGAFSVSTAYTCPFNLSVLYAVARGGKAGASGTANAGSILMTTLGTCNSVSGNPSIVIDEVTTIASAYALAQFMAPGAVVGATATNFNGLKLAAAGATNLANPATGLAPGATFPATGTAPLGVINGLANALHACVVSTGSTSTACVQLYSASTAGGTAPSNTLDAALNIARHPGSNVAALYALSTTAAVFSPAVTAAPSDWTVFATFAGGGMYAPSAIGVDSLGNVWVANYFYVASLFTNTGTPVFANGVTGNNLNDSYGLAIDQSDNVWIPNEQSPYAINTALGSVTVLNTAGQSVAGAGYSQGGLNYPVAVAIDSSGVSWVVDYGNSHLTLLDSSGVPLSGAAGYTSAQFAFPVAVAVDSKCNGYIANQSSNTITKVSSDGTSFTSYSTGPGASGLAVDAADNVWVANYYGNSVGLLSATGAIVSSGYSGGGVNHPQGIAIDGAGNAWIANYRGPSITELAAATSATPGAILSPAAGFGPDANLLEAFGVAIDASGNLWVTNFGNNTITEFIGLAAPVRTPMIGAVATP
jgi:hypothetical protein